MTSENEHGRTYFPSFYGAVHRAWNRQVAGFDALIEPSLGNVRIDALAGKAPLPDCTGREQPYDPDEHPFCYELAALLRIELHAAGITLSNDGNGSILPVPVAGDTLVAGEPGTAEVLEAFDPDDRARVAARTARLRTVGAAGITLSNDELEGKGVIVSVHTFDPDDRARVWNEGFDEGFRQAQEAQKGQNSVPPGGADS